MSEDFCIHLVRIYLSGSSDIIIVVRRKSDQYARLILILVQIPLICRNCRIRVYLKRLKRCFFRMFVSFFSRTNRTRLHKNAVNYSVGMRDNKKSGFKFKIRYLFISLCSKLYFNSYLVKCFIL